MSEQENEQPTLPLMGAGPQLRAAREAAGLTRSEIAARTRISERMITLMEAGDFAGLPARTYATGFTRTYARAVGLDEAKMAALVRQELGMAQATEKGAPPSLEPGDPARVPSARFAWWLALAAVIVLVASLWFWQSNSSPAIDLPSILPAGEPAIEPTFVPDTMAPGPLATLDPLATASADPALALPAPAPRRGTQATRRPRPNRDPLTVAPSPQAETVQQPQVAAPQSPPTSTVSN